MTQILGRWPNVLPTQDINAEKSEMLTPLETAVIDLILDTEGEPFDTIRQQLAHATIVKRESTGVGFFTEFLVPSDTPVRRDLPDATIGDVGAQFPTLQRGAGFLLFIRGGVVTMLEGYTYDEPWPKSTDQFTVHRVLVNRGASSLNA